MPEEQNHSNKAGSPEQSEVTMSCDQKTGTGAEILHCPKCDSPDILKRSGAASFLFVIAGLAVILLLMLLRNLLVLLPLKQFLLALSFAVMFALCLISAEVWLVLIRNCRCESCGYGFRSISKSRREQTTWPFTWRFFLLNAILLLLNGLTSMILLEVLFNDSFLFFLIEAAFPVFFCGFLSFLSLPFHAILFGLLRKKLKNEMLLAVLFIIPAILLGGNDLYQSFPIVRARSVLFDGRLAALPDSATDIKVYHWSGIFSGESFLKFSAEPKDINVFLRSSPSIKGQQCRQYSS